LKCGNDANRWGSSRLDVGEKRKKAKVDSGRGMKGRVKANSYRPAQKKLL